jgi:hypothetical protein
MSIDHPIYTSTSIIKISETYSATGFFFLDKGTLYLVTNKHVVYGKEFEEPQISHFRIVLHVDASNATKNEEVEIDLFNNDGTKKMVRTQRSKC